MANEITLSGSMRVVNGTLRHDVASGTGSFNDDQSTKIVHDAVHAIGTSEEDLSFGDLTLPAWMMINNMDTSNKITWGPKSGASMVTLGEVEAGKSAGPVYIASGVTIRAVATTATVNARFSLIQSD